MKRKPLLLTAALLLLTAAAEPSSTPPVNGYETMRAMDLRLATIGDRLAIGAARRCSDKVFDPGFVLHRIDQYAPADRANIASYFGMTNLPQILAVVPDSGAAKAGLSSGDSIRVVDGVALPTTIASKSSVVLSEAALDQIDKAMADGRAVMEIVSQTGASRTVVVVGKERCHVRFQMVPGDALRASTNGLNLKISSGVMDFAQSDDELAAMVAHEFAHVILKHPQTLRAEGVKQGGIFAGFGKGGKKIRAAEEAADRLSIHLMYGAGYDVRAAPTMWRRYIGRTVGPLAIDLTHGGASKRVRTMEEEIARIDSGKR